MQQQGALALAPDAGNFVQRRAGDIGRALGPVGPDDKAMGFVAQALHVIEDGILRLQAERLLTRAEESFAAGIAIGALGDGDQRHIVDPEIGQGTFSGAKLAGTAVDHDQIGPLPAFAVGIFLLGAGEAPAHHLAHHGVVVARRDLAGDGEFPIGRFHESIWPGDDHGAIGVTALKVAVVIDLDTLGHLLQAKGDLHPLQQLALGGIFGNHQIAPGAAARPTDLDPALGLDAQGLGQQRRLGRQLVHQDQRWGRLVGIEQGDESRQDLGQRQVTIMAREIAAIAEIAAGAEEEDLDAGLAAGLVAGDDIGVADFRDVDVLMTLHVGERAQTVADRAGALEIQRVAGGLHVGCQPRLNVAALAREEIPRLFHQLPVILQRDAAGAGRRAALDLIQQAGARAAAVDAVVAGAQQEGALQRRDGAMHGARRGEWPVVVALARAGAAMLGDLGGGMVAGDQDIGKGFVVAQQHVVAGHQPLDQVDLQQQRLDLGVGGDDLELDRLGDHPAQTFRQFSNLGIGRDALLQIARLAHVERVAGLVQHAIDAGVCRQTLDRLHDDLKTARQHTAGARNLAVLCGVVTHRSWDPFRRTIRYPRNLWVTLSKTNPDRRPSLAIPIVSSLCLIFGQKRQAIEVAPVFLTGLLQFCHSGNFALDSCPSGRRRRGLCKTGLRSARFSRRENWAISIGSCLTSSHH